MSHAGDRLAAARSIGRVVREGSWSNVVVRSEARAAGADPRVVQALAFAVLRSRPLVDRAIESAARRPLRRIDPEVLDLLRVGVAELVERRTPPALVVDGTVRAAHTIAPRAVGFVNAVLREVAGRLPAADSPGDIGIPDFVDSALRHVMSPEEVAALWEASQQSAPTAIRASTGPEGASPVEGIPSAWLVVGRPPADVWVQDPASVAVGNALAAPAEATVLDMAAAPGGKTAHLVDQVGVGGTVVAMDRHRRRVVTGSRRVPEAHWVVGDGEQAPLAESAFDAVLVDAPCTGLGTLRRRPEIRERVTPEGMATLAASQRAMLQQALRLVRPGGRVVYSVCTFTPAETIDVVAGLGARPPDGLPGRPWGDGWLMAPHLGPTDGMFVAVFDR